MPQSPSLTDALQALTNQLGVAAGGEPGNEATVLGSTLMSAQSHVTAQSQALAKRGLKGGDVIISLRGEEQPEGARLLNSVIDVALDKIGEPHAVRAVPPRKPTTARMVMFPVADDHATAFIAELDRITKTLARTHGLKAECRKAVDFSYSTVDKIEGAKAFVDIRMPEAGQGEPHFSLRIDGVPGPLADRLQKTMGLKGKMLGFGSAFADSPDTASRDLKREYSGKGKKTVIIDMEAPYVDAAFADIAAYAGAQKHVGSKTGGRAIGEGS